ncbi:MAG: thioredoxin family protein [Gammaproteobacteria bacterium]|nr:thioredoxin family protein [Gammaproteobacteria bacterium]MCP5137264.1 thioredoxin family protein [Gammaproteobacteria bacterium]
MPSVSSPDVLLLIGPGCPHCAAVLQHLQGLIKDGSIGELRVVNIAQRPELAADLNVRGVPWMRLGDFDLEGAHSLSELREWIARASKEHGLAEYFLDLLGHGQRGKLLNHLQQHPENAVELFHLLADKDAGIDQRVGIGSILEEMAEQGTLSRWIDKLGELSRNPDATVRADALHYLALGASDDARPFLESARNDADDMVRQVAEEILEELSGANAK